MPKREVDIFAGKDSVADKLRKRRIAMESGDPSGGQMPEEGTPQPEPPPPTTGRRNRPSRVIKRGYFIETGEE